MHRDVNKTRDFPLDVFGSKVNKVLMMFFFLAHLFQASAAVCPQDFTVFTDATLNTKKSSIVRVKTCKIIDLS